MAKPDQGTKQGNTEAPDLSLRGGDHARNDDGQGEAQKYDGNDTPDLGLHSTI